MRALIQNGAKTPIYCVPLINTTYPSQTVHTKTTFFVILFKINRLCTQYRMDFHRLAPISTSRSPFAHAHSTARIEPTGEIGRQRARIEPTGEIGRQRARTGEIGRQRARIEPTGEIGRQRARIEPTGEIGRQKAKPYVQKRSGHIGEAAAVCYGHRRRKRNSGSAAHL